MVPGSVRLPPAWRPRPHFEVALNHAKRFWYRAFQGAIRCYQRVFWEFHVCGRDRIPSGPKIFVSNHITSVDQYWIMLALPDPLHMIVGPGFANPLVARVLDYFEQINAMPDRRRQVVDSACRYLEMGESIYITPEGDLQPPFELGFFHTGVAKIYRKSRAAIVPVALAVPRDRIRRHFRWDLRVGDRIYPTAMVWRGPVCVNIGEPFRPAFRGDLTERDDDQRITDEVKARIQRLADEARTSHSWFDS